MQQKVSVGIPAYKPEFLSEAIASVLAQTYEDWELIVVDDCSPADIKGIVDKFNDPRISYYRNEQNLGAEDPSYNWNKCVSYASGEYFCLLCDDDIYDPTFLEEMLMLAEQFPACDVFHARGQLIDAKGKFISKYPSSPLWESCEDLIWHNTRGMRYQTISEWMIRRTHIVKCDGYVHFPCAWSADTASIYRFSVKGGIVSSYKTLMTFRRSGINISTHSYKNLIPKLDALLMAREFAMAIIMENGMDQQLLADIKRQQESSSLWLLGNVSLIQFLKVALLKRKKYGLRRLSIAKSIMKMLRRKFVRQ